MTHTQMHARTHTHREKEKRPHAIPLHGQPQLAECEVFLSRTRPANSNPWLAATLLSITNTGPIYPSAPPPPLSSRTATPGGMPHNGSVATVTDISIQLMFIVLLCLVCWYSTKKTEE